MNSLIFRYFLVELVGIFHRAIFDTGRTTRAFTLFDVTGLFEQSNLEVTRFTFDIIDFGVCHNLNIRMPSNLDELRGEYSYRAVIGGKGFIQLCHMAADGRRFVH